MNTENKASIGTLLEWPVEGLQLLGCCPLCNAGNRTLLHEGLQDKLFNCAPGKWQMFVCGACGLAYLDPRPDLATIGMAYQSYFTHHEKVDDDPANRGDGLVPRLKQLVLRQYIQRQFGNQRQIALSIFGYLMYLRPRQRAAFDGAMRHLPRPKKGQRILDIGCGNGRFLAWARTAGWTSCTGTEVDPNAAVKARARGFTVHLGEVTELLATGERFDVITISHVVEHVHDPRSLLQTAQQLLEPGGVLWIETPNLDAHGHDSFGRAWRDLDAPRHLQLFSHDLLKNLLLQVGFCDIKLAPWQPDWDSTFDASLLLAKLQAKGDRPHRKFSSKDGEVGRQRREKSEFITFIASSSSVRTP